MMNDLVPPVAPTHPTHETLHGERRDDDYRYLRERENPEVLAYLHAENAYTAAQMAHTSALQETLYQEMLGRIQEDDSDVPVARGDWFYYRRTAKDKPYPIYCRKRGSVDAAEEIIFDQNAAAHGHAYYQLGALEVSPDHAYLAMLVDTSGYEDFVLHVRDLDTGSFLPDRIERLGTGLAWASDSRTLFYETIDDAKRSDRVWRHRLGDLRARDVEVYHDPDPLFNVGVARARSGAFVLISSGSFTTTEKWLVDATAPDAAPVLVAPRTQGVEYEVDHGGEWLYLLTNRDGATNFKVMRAPVHTPGAWSEWIAHRDEVFVEGVDVFARHVVLQERREGLRRLRVVPLSAEESDAPEALHAAAAPAAPAPPYDIAFPEPAYGVSPAENPEFSPHAFRFTYSSLVTPPSVFDFDLVTRERTLKKEEPVLGGYDRTAYRVERVMVPARDGARVPVSLVYRAPLVRDGARPLLLYAYGSYGYTMEPTFSSQRISLLDRDVVYAIAHVRGGQEMGRAWYEAGKMRQKLNTFHDFIDCAEWLIAERYTSRATLVAHGASAGGLLMGAVTNLRPDLFHAVVADVPFVDVITTMLDASIPLTAQEWEQWGNPNDAGDYAYMRGYSPYDNVTRRAYPRLLVTSGINDSRVAFWEPAKWVAKLRTHKTDHNVLLLKMNMEAGHGGSSGRYERLREQAFRYAFILDQVARDG